MIDNKVEEPSEEANLTKKSEVLPKENPKEDAMRDSRLHKAENPYQPSIPFLNRLRSEKKDQ